MNTVNELHRVGKYGHSQSLAAPRHALNNHAFLGYLLSIGDVVTALLIMIGICGLSLLTLYVSLGAL